MLRQARPFPSIPMIPGGGGDGSIRMLGGALLREGWAMAPDRCWGAPCSEKGGRWLQTDAGGCSALRRVGEWLGTDAERCSEKEPALLSSARMNFALKMDSLLFSHA